MGIKIYGQHVEFTDLSDPNHLLELSNALSDMKRKLIDDPNAKPPMYCSQKGVAISYAITKTTDGTRMLHHISISRSSGRFYIRNAAFLGAHFIHSLQVYSWLKQMNTTKRKVFHLAFTIAKDENTSFLNKPVFLEQPDVEKLLTQCRDIKIKKLSI